jgi:hypothetical protein
MWCNTTQSDQAMLSAEDSGYSPEKNSRQISYSGEHRDEHTRSREESEDLLSQDRFGIMREAKPDIPKYQILQKVIIQRTSHALMMLQAPL